MLFHQRWAKWEQGRELCKDNKGRMRRGGLQIEIIRHVIGTTENRGDNER
jgi:hypothetical protein